MARQLLVLPFLLAVACGGGNNMNVVHPDLRGSDGNEVLDFTTTGDMAGMAGVDMTGQDLSGVTVDMTGQDLTGVVVDMTGVVNDMTGVVIDMTGVVNDMTGGPVDGLMSMMDLNGIKQPVGHTCSLSSDCGGANPSCRTSFGTTAIPGNYCSNTACNGDGDCGAGGFCYNPGVGGSCFGNCTAAGQCQATNPNNRCFYFDGVHDACLPLQLSACDPTVAASCGSDLCNRAGPDNVGDCLTTCSYGSTCPNNNQGNPQVCDFLNGRVDASGNLTSDVGSGLACIVANAMGAAGDACAFLNDCAAGLECNYYAQGGVGKICQKLCRNGNSTDCNGTGGVCQDAFLLGKSSLWVTGAIGLCLQVPKQPVGHTCSSAIDCDGPNALCTTAFGTIMPPGGYCNNTPCTTDVDCGSSGFCATTANRCLGSCAGPNECQTINPNNRCFFWDGVNNACLPVQFSGCDPTVQNACGSPGFCNRGGFDNVGDCLTTCTYTNQTCPNDSQGNPQQCYMFNNRVDGAGNPTPDVAQGLVCFPINGTAAAGAACSYLNDCAAGLECNFFMAGGKGQICAKMCRNGTPADCNGTGGTCQDAFKLGTGFVSGTIGLCL